MKHNRNADKAMGTENNTRRLTASEKRFANEIAIMMNMSLTELLLVEKTRMPIGV